ncbi:MAG: PHP-associated domain-containing protein, partial [Clostridiales bacterium]
SEEVHVVCLFPDVDSALAFSSYVAERLPKIKNRLDIFGEQLIMDDRDGILGREENLLSTASFISIGEVFPLVSGFGGVCYPAHVDRPSFSVVANLGSFDESWGFANAEMSAFAQADRLVEEHPLLRKMRLLRASDAHCLENVGSASTELELPCASPQAVIDLLKGNYYLQGM